MLTYLSNRFFDGISRYAQNRQIYNSDLDSTYLETTNKYNIDTDDCLYHVVELNEANRLDIIANQYYGDPTYYWAIALANDIIDPFLIKPNTILKIPSFESLFNNRGPLGIK